MRSLLPEQLIERSEPSATALRVAPPVPSARRRGRLVRGRVRALITSDVIAVVIATAVTAFLIVACWSLMGGLATYLIAILLGGALMLAWSKPWLDHFRYGPLEWAWRSLSRFVLQPMRRTRGETQNF